MYIKYKTTSPYEIVDISFNSISTTSGYSTAQILTLPSYDTRTEYLAYENNKVVIKERTE